jgi:putative protein kinase ArgK-like GTPase of G3E family
MHQGASSESAPIERRLRKENSETRKVETIVEAAIADIHGPIVILGDPGLGKSTLTQKLGDQDDNQYVTAQVDASRSG